MCGLCKFWSKLQPLAYKLQKLAAKVDPASHKPLHTHRVWHAPTVPAPLPCPVPPDVCNMDCGNHKVLSVWGVARMAGLMVEEGGQALQASRCLATDGPHC